MEKDPHNASETVYEIAPFRIQDMPFDVVLEVSTKMTSRKLGS